MDKAMKDEVRRAWLADLGLEENEIDYLMAPFKDLDERKGQRTIALQCWEKKHRLLQQQNDEFRRVQAERKAMEEADGELDAADAEESTHDILARGVMAEAEAKTEMEARA